MDNICLWQAQHQLDSAAVFLESSQIIRKAHSASGILHNAGKQRLQTRPNLKESHQPSVKRRPLSILLPSKPRERGTPWRCQETRTGYQSRFENCVHLLVGRESLLSLSRGLHLDIRLGLGVDLLGGRLAVGGGVVLAGALVGGGRVVVLVSALVVAITASTAAVAILGLARLPVIRVASVAAIASTTTTTAAATTTTTSTVTWLTDQYLTLALGITALGTYRDHLVRPGRHGHQAHRS